MKKLLLLLITATAMAQNVNPKQIVGTAVVENPQGTQTISKPMVAPLWTGTSLFPSIPAPVTTTGTSTNTSNTFTVTNATGITLGQAIFASFMPVCSIPAGAFTNPKVTAISGTNITSTCPASASTTASVTFGAVRTSSTAQVTVNAIATDWLLVGGAALGNTGLADLSDPNKTAAQIYGYHNNLGLLVGAKSSDMTSGSGTRPFTVVSVLDSYNAGALTDANWAEYVESDLMTGTANHTNHLQREQSVNNTWPVTAEEDPYVNNFVNQTVDTRLDCGTGQTFGTGAAPNKCTTAMDIVTNGAQFTSGIVIGNGALDTSSGHVAAAMSMPTNVGMAWFSSSGVRSGTFYLDNFNFLRIPDAPLWLNRVAPGVGLQSIEFTPSCSLSNTAFNSCSFGVTFTTPEPDTGYSVVCSVNGANVFMGSVSGKSTSGVNATVYATGTGAPTVTSVACIITHSS